MDSKTTHVERIQKQFIPQGLEHRSHRTRLKDRSHCKGLKHSSRTRRSSSIQKTRVHWIEGNSHYSKAILITWRTNLVTKTQSADKTTAPKELRLLHVYPCWDDWRYDEHHHRQREESQQPAHDVNDITKGEARLICGAQKSVLHHLLLQLHRLLLQLQEAQPCPKILPRTRGANTTRAASEDDAA